MEKLFRNENEPTMNELVYWIQVRFPAVVLEMKESNHNAFNDDPNPYHIEDNVWAHTMMVCLRAEISASEKYNKIPLITALLHDLGKPASRGVIPFEANDIRNNSRYPAAMIDGMNFDELKERFFGIFVKRRFSNRDEFADYLKSLNKEVKTHFRGHEGLSFYKAIPLVQDLKKIGVLNQEEMEDVLRVISLHGTLFDSIDENGEMKKQSKVFDKFENTLRGINLFNCYVTQVRNDSLGRFFVSKDGRKNNAERLGSEIYTEQQFKDYKSALKPKVRVVDSTLTVLIGPPGSGKSTFIKTFVKDQTVISRDELVMEYADSRGLMGTEFKCSNCNKYGDAYEENLMLGSCRVPGCVSGYRTLCNYSDVWKRLSELDLQGEVDKLLESRYQDAVRAGESIVIDMTNCSAKGQRKWVNKTPKNYFTEAIVLATGYDEVFRRVTSRKEETGKDIPFKVVTDMMSSFAMPTEAVFDEVKLVF